MSNVLERNRSLSRQEFYRNMDILFLSLFHERPWRKTKNDMEDKLMDDRTTEIQGEINALKQLLTNSDYKGHKYLDGEITAEEYAEAKAQRHAWRERINELEAELDPVNE